MEWAVVASVLSGALLVLYIFDLVHFLYRAM